MAEIICPHCRNPIYDEDALLCHFCGSSLGRPSEGGVIGRMRSAGMRWVWITLGLIVIIATAATMFF